MKKADNFNPGKWLVENKITFQSRLNKTDLLIEEDGSKKQAKISPVKLTDAEMKNFEDSDFLGTDKPTDYDWKEWVQSVYPFKSINDYLEELPNRVHRLSQQIYDYLFHVNDQNWNVTKDQMEQITNYLYTKYKQTADHYGADLNEIEYMPDTDYEDNWEKGGGMDDEEFDFYSAKIVDKPFPDAKGNDRMIPTLVVDETGDEYQEFYILNTPEDEENLKNDQEMGREIEGVFKVKMDNGEIKTAVVYPPTSSKSEFAGKFN